MERKRNAGTSGQPAQPARGLRHSASKDARERAYGSIRATGFTQTYGYLAIEYVNVGCATLSVRARGSGHPDFETFECLAPGFPLARKRTEERLWQSEADLPP